jgi:hypothetical protein
MSALDDPDYYDALVEKQACEISVLEADKARLLSIIRAVPKPIDMTDSEIAAAYRNWFYGERINRLKSGEMKTK